MDTGRLSYSVDPLGKRTIDKAELFRLFPHLIHSETILDDSEQAANAVPDVVEVLQAELELARERERAALEREKASLEREAWLKARIEELQADNVELRNRCLPPPAKPEVTAANTADQECLKMEPARQEKKGFWARLFGK